MARRPPPVRGTEPWRSAADVLVRESGVVVRRYRTRPTGVAYTRSADWGIEAPEPRSALTFGVFAHEVGHQMLHRDPPRRRRVVEEFEAELYALDQFRRFGLPPDRVMLHHVVRHCQYALAKARRRGLGQKRAPA